MAVLSMKVNKVLAAIACTCPHSVLAALIEKYRFDKEFLPKLLEMPKFADLRKLPDINDEEHQIFKIVCHFVGEKHYKDSMASSIAFEIPERLRPALHLLLPLNKKDEYAYKEVKVKFRNLVQISRPSNTEKGFWAAHLCGKVWIPSDTGLQGDIKTEQEWVEGFMAVMSKITEVNVADYPQLYRGTLETHQALQALL